MSYNTLRSDFMPPPAKLGGGNTYKKKRWIPGGGGRGKVRWRSSLRSGTGNVRPKFPVAGSSGRGKSSSRGRIKVTVPNHLLGITRSRTNVPRTKPKYEFEKYLEALKYEENLKVPQQNVINNQAKAASSSGNSKVPVPPLVSKKPGGRKNNKEESMDVDGNNNESLSDKEHDNSQDRKIQLVKTTVTVPQKITTTAFRTKKRDSQKVFRTLKSNGHSRSSIESRTNRGGRNVRGSNNQPSARLFLQSLPS